MKKKSEKKSKKKEIPGKKLKGKPGSSMVGGIRRTGAQRNERYISGNSGKVSGW